LTERESPNALIEVRVIEEQQPEIVGSGCFYNKMICEPTFIFDCVGGTAVVFSVVSRVCRSMI
jgi:hypothetical protein